MGRLTYFVASTVDGYIAGPEGQHDFFPFEGDHMKALFEEFPETLPVHVRKQLGLPAVQKHFDTVIMGRRTYEPALSLGIEDPYAPLRTFVFSRSLPPRVNGALQITPDDPLSTVRALKRESEARIWLCGGASLASQLAAEIDEVIVKLNPRLAGAGVRLLDGKFNPQNLALRTHRVFNSGVLFLSYDVLK